MYFSNNNTRATFIESLSLLPNEGNVLWDPLPKRNLCPNEPHLHRDNKSQNFRLGCHHHFRLNSQCPYD